MPPEGLPVFSGVRVYYYYLILGGGIDMYTKYIYIPKPNPSLTLTLKHPKLDADIDTRSSLGQHSTFRLLLIVVRGPHYER